MASSTRSADALIGYALEDKPDQKGERYVMASGTGGVLVSVVKQQMRDIRKKWGKDKQGAFVQGYHVIQSFAKDELDPDDPEAWMTAQKLGAALAEDRFPGRQVLVVTQRDGRTGCVHNHLVANSIETKTGRSLNSSIVTHARLVEAHERVLEEQGFDQRADLKQAFSDATERFERGEPSGLRRAGSAANSELREFQRHIIWETECDLADEFGVPRTKQPFSLTVLKASIEATLGDSQVMDWDSFVAMGRSYGVQIEQRGKKGRGISYGMLREEPDGTLAQPASSDRRRCTTLGLAFEMDAVEEAFARNSAVHAQPVPSPSAHRRLTAQEHMQVALAEAATQANELAARMLAEALTPVEATKPVPRGTDGHPASPDTTAAGAGTPAQPPETAPRKTPVDVLTADVADIELDQTAMLQPKRPSRPNASKRVPKAAPEQRRPGLRFPELDDEEPTGEHDQPERSLGE
ncbi:relaxase/mobilization nuclease domain-containing protein [Microbacterium sp.]|uniref:relaxase/mobilization nuclease domain-containing protein n=1 Tax=Microbacterium sp. TaxID=51671 RepID=UPI002737442F|nr:relaxase/mobilization nuclease domain-containing protein [Microbacterium sp.]MDP3952992.1 relaxase/mobilization nuclease domain-containing protein [Microbacterium sp.]